MKISKFFREHLFIFIALIFLSLSFFISKSVTLPPIVIDRQSTSVNINSQLTQFFHLGQKRLLSSLLWITTILESDIEHYKNRDLNSWMFLRFKTISDLEPNFLENYIFGGTYLSIIKDDLAGASIIFDRGLKVYPNDYALLRDAGFHFHFEVADYKKSYEIYAKLAKHPNAPPTFVTTLAKLEYKQGNGKAAFTLLSDKLQSIPDQNSFLAITLKNYLYALKAEADLNCLNIEKAKHCSKLDYFQEPYVQKANIFSAKTPWKPFRLK